MPRSAAFTASLLRHVLHGGALSGLGDTLYVSLHAAAPADQTDSEANYGGYQRVPVPRAESAWTVQGDMARCRGEVLFPVCAGGRCVLTHWALGAEAEGPGEVLWRGELEPPVEVTRPVQPYLPAGVLVIEE